MTKSVEDLISQAKSLERNGKKSDAMLIAENLVAQYPDEMKVWALQGYLHRLNRHYDKAIDCLTQAIAINPIPQLFFARGMDYFALGEHHAAVNDFTSALRSEHYHDESYREVLLFWRAEALLQLGRKRDALSDIVRISDNFKTWTYKLRTKADLFEACVNVPD